eukprot:TRINITY_DN5164_c1_g1_i1.p1 TRINITY_DN5164_c1_g1~~TRINITY_DN5164_c1_g1_i1.p1  ORF type:complete len:442 (-),score=102.81 TRINITY_DN5164_c1_g1_i1:117-1442(-)
MFSGAMDEPPPDFWEHPDDARDAAKAEMEKAVERQKWLQEVVVPLLASTSLFKGCPEEFLETLAGHAVLNEYSEGAEITSVGESTDSMLVVLEGMIGLTSRSGIEIGCITSTGIMGEAELLGLMPHRTAAGTAVTASKVISVDSKALKEAFEAPDASWLKDAFERLIEIRRNQVEENLPLAGMIKLRSDHNLADDIGATILALRSEKLFLEAKQYIDLVPDSDASGPRLLFVARGRVAAEFEGEDMTLVKGSIISEGLLAENGADLRAVSPDCEVYRVRMFDLLIAAHSTQQAPDWFYQLKILERETRAKIQCRLTNAKGVNAARKLHRQDASIKGWKEKREEQMKRARQLKQAQAENVLSSKLPLLPAERFGLSADKKRPGSRQSTQTKGFANAFQALRLIKTHSAPNLHRPHPGGKVPGQKLCVPKLPSLSKIASAHRL